MRKKALIEQLAALKKKRSEENTRLMKLSADGTDIPPAELEAYTNLEPQIESLEAELKNIEALEADAKRISEQQGGGRTTVTSLEEKKPWESMGHFLKAVANAGMPGGTVDPRLNLAASGASEAVPSDGGFLVREEYAALLYKEGFAQSNLLQRTNRIQLSSANRIKIPIVNETSRATGSRWGGVQVYRVNEAGTVTASKPKFDYLEMALEKIMGIAYATEELLADAAAVEGVFRNAFTSEFAFVVDDEIVRGDGAGKMLGILNAPSLVSVAKESGQAADTIMPENIVKMYSRMPVRNRANAVWFVNQDVEPQLYLLQQTVGSVSAWPMFLPPGGLSGAPFSSLMGRPVIPIEQCATVGDVGDILFADMSQYTVIERGGLNAASSMHVRFLYDEMTFRWTQRINGQPSWKSAITPFKGSATVSPFIALAARA